MVGRPNSNSARTSDATTDSGVCPCGRGLHVDMAMFGQGSALIRRVDLDRWRTAHDGRACMPGRDLHRDAQAGRLRPQEPPQSVHPTGGYGHATAGRPSADLCPQTPVEEDASLLEVHVGSGPAAAKGKLVRHRRDGVHSIRVWVDGMNTRPRYGAPSISSTGGARRPRYSSQGRAASWSATTTIGRGSHCPKSHMAAFRSQPSIFKRCGFMSIHARHGW